MQNNEFPAKSNVDLENNSEMNIFFFADLLFTLCGCCMSADENFIGSRKQIPSRR